MICQKAQKKGISEEFLSRAAAKEEQFE